MDPLIALLLVAGVVAAATLVGLVARSRSGRIRSADGRLTADELVEARAGRTTLVQFSTPTCARCPGTARLLRSIAEDRPEAAHVEIDVAARPALADRFGVLQTPTVLVVGPDRRVRARVGGAPVRADVERELDSIVEASR